MVGGRKTETYLSLGSSEQLSSSRLGQMSKYKWMLEGIANMEEVSIGFDLGSNCLCRFQSPTSKALGS
jgi:hypothetical protein